MSETDRERWARHGRQRAIPVKVFFSKFGAWRLRDANGDVVNDEHGEPYQYASEADANGAISTFLVE